MLLLLCVCSLSRKANKCAAEEHCPLCVLGLPAEGLHDKIEGGMRLAPTFPIIQREISKEFSETRVKQFSTFAATVSI